MGLRLKLIQEFKNLSTIPVVSSFTILADVDPNAVEHEHPSKPLEKDPNAAASTAADFRATLTSNAIIFNLIILQLARASGSLMKAM